MAAWATPDALLKLLSDNFDDEGRLKEESTMMARGTFAVVFKGDTIPGGDAQCVVRVTVIPPGDNQELAFDKELQALIAYLKLMKGESSGAPVRDQFVEIRREDQPAGLCRTDAYYIVTTEGRRVVFTVMPLGIPLMNIIEDQLVLASEGGQQERDLGSVLAGMSQLATALKMMHGKAVYWRDCKVDNVVFVGENAEIIDINSGVCTVGYASHEQLVKLPLERFDDSQAITDALERVLLDQPDHQTWETQDVFALSIVVMEWLTYGMFTYPYNRDAGGKEPSYAALLLYELRVYNLVLEECADLYDVSGLKGRLDRKIQHWTQRVGEGSIDATSQETRDLTLWPLAVAEFRRSRPLFDLWAALAFWDHVDHQFGFIGHWFDWYFDFTKYATRSENAAAREEVSASPARPPAEAPESNGTAAEGDGAVVESNGGEPGTPKDGAHKLMDDWVGRAGTLLGSDVGALQARMHDLHPSHQEDEHTARVVKRLSTLTKRMDSLNSSLSTFWAADPMTPSPARKLPGVRIAYANAAEVAEVLAQRDLGIGAHLGGKATQLVEVRLRLRTGKGDAAQKAAILEALGKKSPGIPEEAAVNAE